MVHVILWQTDVKNCANTKYKIILTNCLSVQNILSMGTWLSVPESFWKLYSKPTEISNPALPICNCILSYTYYIFHIVVTYHVVFLLLYCFLCYVACFLFAQACFIWSQCMHRVNALCPILIKYKNLLKSMHIVCVFLLEVLSRGLHRSTNLCPNPKRLEMYNPEPKQICLYLKAGSWTHTEPRNAELEPKCYVSTLLFCAWLWHRKKGDKKWFCSSCLADWNCMAKTLYNLQ